MEEFGDGGNMVCDAIAMEKFGIEEIFESRRVCPSFYVTLTPLNLYIQGWDMGYGKGWDPCHMPLPIRHPIEDPHTPQFWGPQYTYPLLKDM
ncbi:unnamed protein product [Sphenostylis stenocarpa]|uniref:Uncharacterized protein n=1 Tax=Sphenostylis stenocarpa TaxID=92480 RepID=A0AA86RNX1_9FABA|nr:unnamed protein product [Sphenostylis stenocarpa]